MSVAPKTPGRRHVSTGDHSFYSSLTTSHVGNRRARQKTSGTQQTASCLLLILEQSGSGNSCVYFKRLLLYIQVVLCTAVASCCNFATGKTCHTCQNSYTLAAVTCLEQRNPLVYSSQLPVNAVDKVEGLGSAFDHPYLS